MTKNEAIKFAASHYPWFTDAAIEMAAKLNELDENWHRHVGEGYTLEQLARLAQDLTDGKEHKLLPRDPAVDFTKREPKHDTVVEGVFSIEERDFAKQSVDVVTYKGHGPRSVFYLCKICRNCGVAMVINFEQIPKDVAKISAAMLTLERVFYRAGHEDDKL